MTDNENRDRTESSNGREPTVAAAGNDGSSIPVRVNAAVSNRLRADRRWPPNNLGATMEGDYNYSRVTLRNFLASVRATLRREPPLRFDYDNAFVLLALPMTVGDLMAAIEARTHE